MREGKKERVRERESEKEHHLRAIGWSKAV